MSRGRRVLWVIAIVLLAFLVLFVIAAILAPEPEPDAQASRCADVPAELVQQLNNGLTAAGPATVNRVKVVESNNPDGLPWKFIGADVDGPGLEDVEAWIWATASLDLDTGAALIVAVDHLAEEFSIFGFPREDRFYFTNDERYDDEIKAVKDCVNP